MTVAAMDLWTLVSHDVRLNCTTNIAAVRSRDPRISMHELIMTHLTEYRLQLKSFLV